MRKASGTHRSMGKMGGVKPGLDSGVTESMKIPKDSGPDTVSGSQRPKAQKHGSIASKK